MRRIPNFKNIVFVTFPEKNTGLSEDFHDENSKYWTSISVRDIKK